MGALDDLMGAGKGFLDRRYADNEKFRESFKNNPLGHLMQDLLTGASAIGGPAAPMMRPPAPLPPGGAAPPPGNYFRPPDTPHPWLRQTNDPVASLGSYAKDFRFTDPKTLASDYLQMFPERGEAAGHLSGGLHTTDLSKSAAGLLQRNQALIDLMSNAEANGPWGPRQ